MACEPLLMRLAELNVPIIRMAYHAVIEQGKGDNCLRVGNNVEWLKRNYISACYEEVNPLIRQSNTAQLACTLTLSMASCFLSSDPVHSVLTASWISPDSA